MAETHLQGVEISASQFLEIWRHYDTDGNGFIEGKELQNFIQELLQARKKAGLELSEDMKAFVEQYGQNSDAKIGIVELAQILPTEENFLLFFRQQLKSSEEFMQTWRRYDTDHSGFIETDELKMQQGVRGYKEMIPDGCTSKNPFIEASYDKWLTDGAGDKESFLKDLLKKANKPYEDIKLEEYTQIMLRMFDSNNDGKLGLTEMARLLPVHENFLLKFQEVKMCNKEFNKAFELYDKDGSGYIDDNELDALLKDLCEKNKKDLDVNSIPTYKKNIMALSDGGKLYRTELALVLCADEN